MNQPDGWRIANIERRLENLERLDPAVVSERVAQLERRLDDRVNGMEARIERRIDQQDEETGALRRAIIAAAITIATSAVITTLTVYLVFGP